MDPVAPDGYYQNISFSPGQTWVADYDLRDPRYGDWTAKNWWVPQGWAANDGGLDWGLIELYPNANGNYPGDFTGTFTATMNIEYSAGAHAYPVGYPTTGVFSTLHNGYGQYFCDVTWDGYTLALGSNVALSYECPMTPGVSGGAVFVELNTGQWVIGGVANKVHWDQWRSTYLHTLFFDNRLGEFYRSIYG
jgi:V8-like Glu-specific endopeptidase